MPDIAFYPAIGQFGCGNNELNQQRAPYHFRQEPMIRVCILSLLTLLCWLHPGLAEPEHPLETRFLAAGLVDVATWAPSIRVDLVNADASKNFFGQDFYQGLTRAYLQEEVAKKLAQAQEILRRSHPTHSLQILDAARPRTVSQAMYDQVQGTRFERFVADPAKGSMHNYGVAVDITIVDSRDRELDMGPSPFRTSTLGLYWRYALHKLGKDLSDEQKANRALLSTTMQEAGFLPLPFEWWHFNGMEKREARRRFHPIE
jgi:zinc D-Ala-D-Ala dipeptidase